MTYVISDIHGEYDLLLKLLESIEFSDGDELYVCGDMIEKGNDSVRVLQFLRSKKNVYCIIGNHEFAFLKRYWALTENDTVDFDEVLRTLQAYFPYDGHLLDWETIDWLEGLPYYIEKEDFICVHAGLPLDEVGRILPLKLASIEQLVYDRNFKETDLLPQTEKCIFFGHTPTSYLIDQPKILAYKNPYLESGGVRKYCKIHLDLGVWLDGVMGCFCVETCRVHYVKK